MEPQNETQQTQDVPVKKGVGINTPAAIVTAGVLIALALFLGRGGAPTQQQPQGQQPEPTAPLGTVTVRDTDPVRGDITTADVIIVEYSDSDCPFCERFHNTMKSIIADKETSVAWVYRHFPLSIHPNAVNEAIALTCVQQLGGNDAFWNYLDSVIGITLSPEKSTPILTSLAVDEGVNASAFATCIADKNVQARVQQESAEAQSLGAKGTPYSVAINRKTGAQVVIPGAVPLEQLQQTIAGLLK